MLARITPTADYADLAGCDLVVEAVFEKASLKHEVFAETEQVVDAGRAARLEHLHAADHRRWPRACERKADFIGLHFFSPVDKMPLLEIIRGEQTSDERAGPGAGLRRADQEDADRGQRQPRLLHLAG